MAGRRRRRRVGGGTGVGGGSAAARARAARASARASAARPAARARTGPRARAGPARTGPDQQSGFSRRDVGIRPGRPDDDTKRRRFSSKRLNIGPRGRSAATCAEVPDWWTGLADAGADAGAAAGVSPSRVRPGRLPRAGQRPGRLRPRSRRTAERDPPGPPVAIRPRSSGSSGPALRSATRRRRVIRPG